MIIAEDERLRVRWLIETDAGFIHRLYNTDGFLRFVGDRNIRSNKDALEFLIEGPIAMYKHEGIGLYMVELTESDIPLGVCGLMKRAFLDDIEIGFGFLPEHWGFGYAIESAEAVVEYAKTKKKLKRLVAVTAPTNAGSVRILSQLGMTFKGKVEREEGNLLDLYGVEFED